MYDINSLTESPVSALITPTSFASQYSESTEAAFLPSTFKFQKINSIIGSGNYLTIVINEISNNVNIDGNYSKINVGLLNDKSKNININTGYTNISLGYTTNYAFDFDINTKYANIKSDGSLEIAVNETKNNSKRISGFYKKKGQNKVIVNSNYGNVILVKKQ